MALLALPAVLLIFLTFISYIPQYHRLLILGTSSGLSLGSVTAATLVAQVQVATMYFLFKSAPLMRYGTPIATPTSTRDWLNLTQILTQWACSMLHLAIVLHLPLSATDPASAALYGKKTAMGLLISHLLLFIFCVRIGGRPEDVVFNIMRNINADVVNPIFTLLAVIAFILQACTTSSTSQPSALSEWTLGLQAFIFLLLAITWPFRLILPRNMWELGSKPALLMEWYPWVGWACVNNAVFGVGQGVLLLLYTRRHKTGGNFGSTDEGSPLLS